MTDDTTDLGQLAADCDLLAYDRSVAVEDRLILINLANDLREAQYAKMAQPVTLADVLKEGPNISRKPTMFILAGSLLILGAATVGALAVLGVAYLYHLLTD
jgi:hypothetical protein